MRPITKIIIQLIDVENVDALIEDHKKKGMAEVGFHYMVDPEGNIELGRSINNIGNHYVGENAISLGIGCIGNRLTAKHKIAIDTLIEELSIKGIDVSSVFFVDDGELKKYE